MKNLDKRIVTTSELIDDLSEIKEKIEKLLDNKNYNKLANNNYESAENMMSVLDDVLVDLDFNITDLKEWLSEDMTAWNSKNNPEEGAIEAKDGKVISPGVNVTTKGGNRYIIYYNIQ